MDTLSAFYFTLALLGNVVLFVMLFIIFKSTDTRVVKRAMVILVVSVVGSSSFFCLAIAHDVDRQEKMQHVY